MLRLSRIGKNRNVVKMSVMGPEGIIMDALYFGDTDVFFDFLEEEYGRDNVAAALRGMRNTIDIGVTYYPQINEFQREKKPSNRDTKLLQSFVKLSIIKKSHDTRLKATKPARACTIRFLQLGTRKNMRMQRFSKKISESECF